MSPMPVVRPARPGDADNIASLVERYWEFENIHGFESSRTLSLITHFLSHESLGKCWVAEIGGHLVAYLLVVYMFSLEHGGLMAEIDEFFIVAEYRSQGVGTALLREAEQTMAQAGLKRLQLQLKSNNVGRRFYEKMEFEPRGYLLMDKPLLKEGRRA